MNNRIEQFENQLQNMKSSLSKLEGKYDYLKETSENLKEKDKILKHDLEIHQQAVAVLNLVQKITRDKVKEQFEQMVTYALQYILDDENYKFVLEFGNRGNLGELDFNIVTPDCQKPVDLFTANAGGELDVCSLALRVVLLELDQRKEKNFILLDESFKWVSTDHLERCNEFIEMLNKKLGWQIILVTHKTIFAENCDNPIEVK